MSRRMRQYQSRTMLSSPLDAWSGGTCKVFFYLSSSNIHIIVSWLTTYLLTLVVSLLPRMESDIRGEREILIRDFIFTRGRPGLPADDLWAVAEWGVKSHCSPQKHLVTIPTLRQLKSEFENNFLWEFEIPCRLMLWSATMMPHNY